MPLYHTCTHKLYKELLVNSINNILHKAAKLLRGRIPIPCCRPCCK